MPLARDLGVALVGFFALSACSGSDSSTGSGGTNSAGGASPTAGTSTSGGPSSSAGSPALGGSPAVGGVSSTAARSSTGGAAMSTGGQLSAGGSGANGGLPSGGNLASGGTSSLGGSSGAGAKASGGSISTGGTSPAGGTAGGNKSTGGSQASAGSTAAGGTSTIGGNKATGGTTATAGSKATGGTAATGGGKATGGASATGGTSAGGATGCGYYVDSTSGNDSSDGRTSSTAWKSLTKVNAASFQPGDKLCFRAGGSWTGQLAPRGSGSSTAPIVIDEYDTGAKPRIAAGASDLDTVRFVNQSYWEINNLEITNQKSSVGDYRGIDILGRDAGTLNHFYIRNCNIHDVTGEVNWIGGDTADNLPGVTFQTGWDASKRTGGIVFEVDSTATTPVKTKFNEVIIENNVITDCSFAGIAFKQLDGNVHWGVRNSATDSNFTPHTNITIRNNYLSQKNTTFGCNAMYLTDMQNGLIEGNVVAQAGTSGIELYYTDAVTVQHNETYGTVRKANGADYNGIDSDKGTTKSIIQYNYIHDNGDGILLCQFSFGNSIVRYNIITNNSRYQVYLHSDAAASSAIYNNTVYTSKNANLVYGYGTYIDAPYTLTNNIFVSTGTNAVLTTGGGITYSNNAYFGPNVTAVASDTRALTSDPRLANPGQGGNGTQAGPAFASLTGYKLATGSPAINAGTSIANNGGLDFWGTTLYVGNPDVGAYEAP